MTQFDYYAAMNKLSRDDYAAYIFVLNEWNYMVCDRVTRETGRLTKATRFVQCRGFALRSLNREWLKMDGAVAKEMEDCYPQVQSPRTQKPRAPEPIARQCPLLTVCAAATSSPQLLQQILVLDPASWAVILWRAVKVLFPARMVEKVDLIPTPFGARALKTRVLRHVALSDLPVSHGGTRVAYPCPLAGR
jgi:hypothetical protein